MPRFTSTALRKWLARSLPAGGGTATPDGQRLENGTAPHAEQRAEQRRGAPWRKEHLRLTLDMAGMCTLEWAAEDGALTWSDSCQSVLGVAPGWPGDVRSFMRLLTPGDRTRLRNIVHGLRVGETESLEFPFHRPDTGEMHWLKGVLSALGEPGQPPTHYVGVVRDITERTRHAQALQQALEDLRLVTDNIPGVIAYVDRSERFRFVNTTHELWFGVPRERVLGRTQTEANPARARLFQQTHLDRALAGQVVVHETAVETRQGVRSVITHLVPHVGPDNNVLGAYLLVSDVSELRGIERARRQSEERLQLALQAAGMAIIEWELADQPDELRDRPAPQLGLKRQLRVSWNELSAQLTPSDRAALVREVADAMGDGRTNFYGEYRTFRQGNEERWVSIRGEIKCNPDGRPTGLHGVLFDITPRKKSQAALAAANERFQLAEEASNGFIWDWDVDSGRVTRTAGFARVAGYALDEWPAQVADWLALVHRDDRARVVSAWRNVPADSNQLSLEYRVRHKTGRYLYVWDRALLMRDADGRLGRAVGITVDISERKLMEAALRESEARFRVMADASPVLVWVTDAEGNIEFINRAYADFFGVELGVVRGQGWVPLIHPDDRDRYIAAFATALSQQTAFYTEARVWSVKGDWRWIASYGAPRFTPAGQFAGMVGSSPDISSLKRAEDELRQARDQAQAAAREAVRTAQQIETLQVLTAALSETVTVDQVLDVVADHSLSLLKAQAGLVGLLQVEEGQVTIVRARGYPEALIQRWAQHPLDSDTPMTDAIRAREPILIESAETASRLYPHLMGDQGGLQSWALFPLIVEHKVLGVIDWGFAQAQHFDEGLVSLMQTLAQQSAQALQRAQLYEQEKSARRVADRAVQRAEFLAGVAGVVAQARTRADLAARVTHLCVPQLGDWCALFISEAGAPELVSATHCNPAHDAALADVVGRHQAALFAAFEPRDPSTEDPWHWRHVEVDSVTPDVFSDDVRAAFTSFGFERLILVRLQARGEPMGWLVFGGEASATGPDLGDLAQEVAQRVAPGLDNLRLFVAEQGARETAESQRDRMAVLQGLTAALADALTPEAVAEVVFGRGLAAIQAKAGWLGRLDDDGRALIITHMTGYDERAVAGFRRMSLELNTPTHTALRERRPVFVTSLEEWQTRYPDLLPHVNPQRLIALSIPLMVKERVLGTLNFSFASDWRLSPEDLIFVVAVGQQCALALERARLFEEEQASRAAAERERERTATLAEVSRVLTRTLDYQTLLHELARVVVPSQADYSLVYGLDHDGSTLRGVACAHAQPERQPEVDHLMAAFGDLSLDASTVNGSDLLAGRGRLLATIDGDLSKYFSADVARRITALGSRSCITVPLHVQGRTVATMTLVMTDYSGRRYGPEDLALAEELAQRAALAIDNARLYAELHGWSTELESRVEQRTAELRASQAELQRLSTRLEQVREGERSRISREIHDELGGALTGIKMGVIQLQRRVRVHMPADDLHFSELVQLVDSTLQTVRRIASDLRPAMLDALGLVPALEWLADQFTRRTGVDCVLTSEVAQVDLDADTSTAVFRVVQEALTNAARHAQASEVLITLDQVGAQLVIRVSDNGRGIDAPALRATGSLGLVGMRERMRQVGGDFHVETQPDQGTSIVLLLTHPMPSHPAT